jgi:cobalamin-dependent methionine synthase I
MNETTNTKLGRPTKGKGRRIELSVYVSNSTIDTVEAYVAERQQTERNYSRSDFFNEAAEKHLQALGLVEPEDTGAEA